MTKLKLKNSRNSGLDSYGVAGGHHYHGYSDPGARLSNLYIMGHNCAAAFCICNSSQSLKYLPFLKLFPSSIEENSAQYLAKLPLGLHLYWPFIWTTFPLLKIPISKLWCNIDLSCRSVFPENSPNFILHTAYIDNWNILLLKFGIPAEKSA